MVERGEVALEDPLSRFVPLDPAGPPITLLDLATHTAGLPRLPPLPSMTARAVLAHPDPSTRPASWFLPTVARVPRVATTGLACLPAPGTSAPSLPPGRCTRRPATWGSTCRRSSRRPARWLPRSCRSSNRGAGATNAIRSRSSWLLRASGGRTITWHNGGTGGFGSLVGFDADVGRGVVVLTNAEHSAAVDNAGFAFLGREAEESGLRQRV